MPFTDPRWQAFIVCVENFVKARGFGICVITNSKIHEKSKNMQPFVLFACKHFRLVNKPSQISLRGVLLSVLIDTVCHSSRIIKVGEGGLIVRAGLLTFFP